MRPIPSTEFRLPEELSERIVKALSPDLRVFTNNSGTNPYLGVVQKEVDDHLAGVSAVMQSIVTEWESMMGDADKSLYSLGLRHAIDIIHGVNPTTTWRPNNDSGEV